MELHCLYPSYHHNVTFDTEEPENTVDLQMKQMLWVKKVKCFYGLENTSGYTDRNWGNNTVRMCRTCAQTERKDLHEVRALLVLTFPSALIIISFRSVCILHHFRKPAFLHNCGLQFLVYSFLLYFWPFSSFLS